MSDYNPRRMSRRFYKGAPEVVRDSVLGIFMFLPAAPLEYDVILSGPLDKYGMLAAIDFGRNGERGDHFHMEPHELTYYQSRNRKKRVAWMDLPEATRSAIVAYVAARAEVPKGSDAPLQAQTEAVEGENGRRIA